jgi:uncharacterized protein (TIGR02246 family)
MTCGGLRRAEAPRAGREPRASRRCALLPDAGAAWLPDPVHGRTRQWDELHRSALRAGKRVIGPGRARQASARGRSEQRLAARPARALIPRGMHEHARSDACCGSAGGGDLLTFDGEVAMNGTLGTTFGLAALTLLACAPSGETAARSAGQLEAEAAVIRELSRQWSEAMRRQDVAALLAMYTGDAVIYEPGLAPITGGEGLRQHFEELAALEILTIDDEIRDVEVARSGDLAVESGYSRWEWRDGEGRQHLEHGPYVVVWRRQDGAWRVAKEIFNSDRPQAPRPIED